MNNNAQSSERNAVTIVMQQRSGAERDLSKYQIMIHLFQLIGQNGTWLTCYVPFIHSLQDKVILGDVFMF